MKIHSGLFGQESIRGKNWSQDKEFSTLGSLFQAGPQQKHSVLKTRGCGGREPRCEMRRQAGGC